MVSANTALPIDAYVPILKAKRAEYDAVSSCTSDRIVPLLEVITPESASVPISRSWARPTDVLWVQVLNPEGTEDATFATQVGQLFDELRSAAVLAVPVITITEEPATLAAIANVMTTDGRGVVLRIDVEELIDETIDTEADVTATLAALSATPEHVDIVLDAGLLSGSPIVQSAVASQALQSLPFLSDWRTNVAAFSAFPEAIGEIVPRESVVAIPRTDAAAYVAARHGATRPIIYGDYAIGVPTYGGAPFTPIPNIRYASGNEWFVHRARERSGPGPQYRALAAAIVSAPYFSGPSFSPGDQQISDVAGGISGPGNATTHLRAGISRHLHVVLERLATLGEP